MALRRVNLLLNGLRKNSVYCTSVDRGVYDDYVAFERILRVEFSKLDADRSAATQGLKLRSREGFE